MFTRTLKASINEEGFSFNVWKITVRPVSSIDTDPRINLVISKRKLFPTSSRNSREERSLSFSNSPKFLPFFSLAIQFRFQFEANDRRDDIRTVVRVRRLGNRVARVL